MDKKEIRKIKQAEYDKNNTVQVIMKLNKNTDGDIIQFLNKCNNKQGLIKRLIRIYINSGMKGLED